MTPTILNNRYRVLQVLAKGGFGETFLAEDSFLPSKRSCVIKQLKTMADNPQVYRIVQDRFHREAAILEELGRSSSQIPELYAYFEESDRFYLVQEWIEGKTLASQVSQSGLFDESTARQLLGEILPVLSAIHSRGIIHRDIKPDNIILRQVDKKPVLIDFGAVKESVGTLLNSQGQTVSSIVIGTPGYMSPEQGVGRPVFSSDLYSLGLTIIYLFTGKLPQDIPSDHRTGDLLWRDLAPTVSDALANILDQTIQYHPRDRFTTAQEVLNALQSSLPSPIPPTQPVQHFPPIPPTVPVSGSPVPPTAPGSNLPYPLTPPPSPAFPPSLPPTPTSPPPPTSSPTPHSPLPTPHSPIPSTQFSFVPPVRSLIAIGITAGILAALGAGGYVYVQQQTPYREAQASLEEIQMLHLQGNHQECINRARTFPRDFPELLEQVRMILTNCSEAQDEETFEAAVMLATQANPDLEGAIEKAQTISAGSPIYNDAKKQIYDWQANVLQAYLNEEASQIGAEVAVLIAAVKPTVVAVTETEVTIRYDGSSNARFTQDEVLRQFAAFFMEVIRGNNKEFPTQYTDFDQIVVYPEQRNRQATLTAEQWEMFVNTDQSEEKRSQLASQAELADR
ncbi:protein kinase domain-containing protein [Egbenema bharatensis]|uniref:protein kinase domain-containing protein n=1 Tax=Egbenema bharatensis TaxID=3463334 RepID=UPI003A8C8900